MFGYDWLVGKVGKTAAPWIIGIVLILILIAILLFTGALNNWRNRSAVEAQTRQTTASGEATAKAGSNAVNVATDRANDEAAIDRDVSNAQERIDNAKTVDDVHAGVRDALCMRDPSRRECSPRPVR